MAPSRVLLTTVHDNGLCPCPHCLMPKTHLNWTGWILNSKFRTDGLCKYLREKVQVVWDFIYRLGHAVTGTWVNDLLKSTSSVPTIVSEVPCIVDLWLDSVQHRIPSVNSSNSLERNSVFLEWWLLTFYMSLNLVSGRCCSLTWFRFSMQGPNNQVLWQIC